MDPSAQQSSENTAAQAAPTPSQVPAAPSPDIPSAVDQDCTCAKCSYNLRGLSATGNCPECATPISDSFQNFLLQYADRSYLAALQRGATLILVGSVVLVVMSYITIGASWFLSDPSALLTLGTITLVICLFTLYGMWVYTNPEPLSMRHARLLTVFRELTRLCVVCVAPLAVLGVLIAPIDPLFSFLTLRLMVLPAIAMLPCMLLYTRWLARRMPDPVLVRRCGIYAWLLPLLVLPGCLLLVGPAFALILYVPLLHRVSSRLRALQSRGAPVSEVH